MLTDKSRVFTGVDPFQVSDYVNEHVGSHYLDGSRCLGEQAILCHKHFGSIDLGQIKYGADVTVLTDGLQACYHLQMMLNGNCLYAVQVHEYVLSAGELLLINPEDPVRLEYSYDCEKLILKIPRHVVEKACADSFFDVPVGGVRFAARHEPRCTENFSDLLSLICNEAESGVLLPATQEQYVGVVSGKMLSRLKSNVSMEPLTSSCETFERLLNHIESNLKQDITMDQLAAIGGKSVRTLYSLFERKTGLTPRLYIRQRRLEKVRECLRNPGSNMRNVTEVALDYGFLHLGHFSENYKNMFGELPSDTLRHRSNG